MTQVFASMVVTTTTVATEGEIPVVASVASWAEFLADLEPATSRKTSNRPEDAATDRRGVFFYSGHVKADTGMLKYRSR